MKKITMFLVLACISCAVAFAQQSYYVSANGSNDNDGLTESKPLKSLWQAFRNATESSIKRITVIGTLNEQSEGIVSSVFFQEDYGTVFGLNDDDTQEITITGKPGVNNANRAILSARGSSAGVLTVDANVRIRFEHIEISGGEGNEEYIGIGLIIEGGASVTLGTGAMIRNNTSIGISISDDGTCIIDGGEIRDNEVGVFIREKGVLTMRSGTIRDNKSSRNGGGVFVNEGGRFTMTGGTITANNAGGAGGGVYVTSGGRFDQTGGTINGNIASRGSNPNIFRAQGSLGSNLR